MNQPPPPSSEPLTKLELRFSCQNLVNMDTLSKSDPMVIVLIPDKTGKWVEYARTEMIRDSLNPAFVKAIMIDYRFEEIQKLKLMVVDVDNPGLPLDNQDLIGEVECRLSDIVTAKESKLVKELKHSSYPNHRRGLITVVAEEIRELGYQVRLHFNARGLDKKDFFGKSDPFLVINRTLEGGNLIPVCKSEVIKKTLDPDWKPFTTTLQNLCNGDYDRPLVIEVFDWNKSGSHEKIGQFTTSLRELESGQKKEFSVINQAYVNKKKNYVHSGVVRLIECQLIKTHSFLDYIAGGCEINLVVGIDFTASNGNPTQPNSLHYMNPYEPNEYIKALASVGSILADYDYDRNFPVYGFGAQLPPSWQVSHCFPLNGNYENPEVHDVTGIIDIYQRAIQSVRLYGPTLFAPLINTTAKIAGQHNTQQKQKYFILLMITDGVITDMDATIDAIVAANDLPLSIVIVGVGNEDFSKMDVLDADDIPLRASNGRVAKRDIVQFVPMRNFRNLPPAALSKATLEEIPGQLVSYMRDRGFIPNDPHTRPDKPTFDKQFSFSNMGNAVGNAPGTVPGTATATATTNNNTNNTINNNPTLTQQPSQYAQFTSFVSQPPVGQPQQPLVGGQPQPPMVGGQPQPNPYQQPIFASPNQPVGQQQAPPQYGNFGGNAPPPNNNNPQYPPAYASPYPPTSAPPA